VPECRIDNNNNRFPFPEGGVGTITNKAVPLHTVEALGGTEGVAPTHSRPCTGWG
jgi:hypothetical protein